jgi:hypothetical protein
MGIAQDLLTNMSSRLQAGSPLHRFLTDIVNAGEDTEIASGADTDAVAVVPAEWQYYVQLVSGGTYDLDIDVGEETISLTGLAYDHDGAALLAAINAAAGGGDITGWTNGDIEVDSGGALTSNPRLLTFSGDSVVGKTIDFTFDGTNLTGGTPDFAASEQEAYVAATPERPAYALLKQLGVIAGSAPAFGVVPTTQFTAPGPLKNPGNYPGHDVIEELIREINVTEGIDAFPYFENLLKVEFTRQ